MNTQKVFHFGCRIPGELLVNMLAQATALPLKKSWQIDPDDETHLVSLICVRCHGRKMEAIPSVQIKIMEPIFPDRMYTSVTFQLVVVGAFTLFTERAVRADFEDMKKQLTESLKRYQTRPFRVFEHQHMQLSA